MSRILLQLLALLAAFGCDACGPGVTLRAKAAPSPQPACAALPSPGKPTLCIPEGGTDQFVVGLPEEHGWERGDWVTVNVAQPGMTKAWPIALAVLVEPYRDVARASVLYQRGKRGLEGGRVRRIGKGEHARLGKFVGSIARVEGDRVELDLGSKDDARAGDIYEIRSAQDSSRPIARVRVTELGDLHLWAVPLDRSEPLREGLIAVYVRGHEASDGEEPQVSILVADFAPTHEQDAEEAKAAQGYSKELASALDNAAGGMQGVSVRYEGDERVRLTGSDAEAHAEARSLGKRHTADIVVWGSMRCREKACARPRFTVVDPDRQQKASDEGVRGAAGVTLDGAAPTEPLVLAAAILGSVAFDTRRYADASYYLHQAVSKKILGPEDELCARQNLSRALSVRGQTAAARAQANALLKRARELHAVRWEELGHRELARLDEQEGRIASSREHLPASPQGTAAHDSADGEQPALHVKAPPLEATTTPAGRSVPRPSGTLAALPGATAARPRQRPAGIADVAVDDGHDPYADDDAETRDGDPCSPTCQQQSVLKVVGSLNHTCTLLKDGSVKCGGYNSSGQLGVGGTIFRGDGAGEMGDDHPALDLGTGKTAIALAADSEHTCTLLNGGSVKCWGLGDDKPAAVAPPPPASSISTAASPPKVAPLPHAKSGPPPASPPKAASPPAAPGHAAQQREKELGKVSAPNRARRRYGAAARAGSGGSRGGRP